AEQVAHHREAAALDAGEQQGRPARLVDAAVDLGRLQIGVDLLPDADQLPRPLQVGDAFLKTAITHDACPPRRSPGVATPGLGLVAPRRLPLYSPRPELSETERGETT